MHIIETTGVTRPDGRMLDNIEGKAYGTSISLILEDTDAVGSGPRLHQHPYPETFVIHHGKALFTIGGEEIVGEAGHVLVTPANTPHKFAVLGPDRYVATHIHESGTFVTTWLED